MGENSKIEWTDHTFNPWIGCAKVHQGCTHCYAETLMDTRYGKVQWGPNGTRVLTSPSNWAKPLKWNEMARLGVCPNCHGRSKRQTPGRCERCDGSGNIGPYRARVFCASLADVFEDWQGPILNSAGCGIYRCTLGCGKWLDGAAPKVQGAIGPYCTSCDKHTFDLSLNDVRERLFALIDDTQHLDWLLLTKRPENVRRMWADIHGISPIFPGAPGALGQPQPCVVKGCIRPNVWLGTSISDQSSADRQVPVLLTCRDMMPVLFLSVEPLLGHIDLPLPQWFFECNKCGAAGESKWRPGNPCGAEPAEGYESDGECTGDLTVTRGTGIDWVIAGGESGPNARPMHPNWVRSLRDQCVAAGVPFFFKQWGEWAPLEVCAQPERDWPPIGADKALTHIHKFPDEELVFRIGKAAAGRTLDGRTWDEWPKGT